MFHAIRTLTKRTYKKNKGRNAVAILAIILTTMMFTTLFTLAQSMKKNSIEMAFRQAGYTAHASCKSIKEDEIAAIASHPDVVSYGESIVLGVATNASLNGRQVEVRYASRQYAENGFALPTTGRMPGGVDEIALDQITLDRLGIPHKLGEKVTLEWSGDAAQSTTNRNEFTLCGFWEGNLASYASMAWVSREFADAAIDHESDIPVGQTLESRMMEVTFQSDRNIEEQMDKVLEDVGLSELDFNVNLAYDPSMQAGIIQDSIPMYFSMLLVFLAGYLIIYNIFQISVTTDIQLYGKLKTLGMTRKQIRRMILGQANRMSLVGIPLGLGAGYCLGVILVPVLISWEGVSGSASANPVIFIGAAAFAWITVLVSCLRPSRIAGKVSPIEALRYNESRDGDGRKTKKSRGRVSVFDMAWANLGRNRKRTVVLICSLSLGLVLLSCFYAKDKSFDMDKYLADLAIADFQIDDTTSEDYINGYNPRGKTISDVLIGQIEALEGIEDTGRVYSAEEEIELTDQAVGNLKEFYEKPGRLESMADQTVWTEEYRNAIKQKRVIGSFFGVDGIALDSLSDKSVIREGSFDEEKFSDGNYIIAGTVDNGGQKETLPTFSVGDSVTVQGKKYEVMMIVLAPQPVCKGAVSSDFNLEFYLPTEEFRTLYPQNTVRKYYFNITDSQAESALKLLSDYQRNVDSTLPFTSKRDIEEQYRAETHSSAVIGNAISIIIALVGVLNFLNSMITAILSRRKEFAMLQSVGMTKAQLRNMLIFEGLDYACLTLVISFGLSTLAILTVVRAMVEGGYTTFRFTLLPLAVCTPLILGLAVFIPYICFRNLEKQSLVERLRNTL